MKIGYSETFPILHNGHYQKNWLEDEIDLNIDLINCTDEEIAKAMLNVRKIQYALQRQVQSFFYESQNHEKKLNDTPVVSLVKSETVKQLSPEEKMINQINEITDKTVLESFKLLASKNEKIKSAYDNRLKQLTA